MEDFWTLKTKPLYIFSVYILLYYREAYSIGTQDSPKVVVSKLIHLLCALHVSQYYLN